MEKPEWFKAHEEQDSKHFKEIEAKLDKIPTPETIEQAVNKGLYEFFKTSGNVGYKAILVLASIIVALGVITGGFKWLLGLIGFVQIK